MAHLDKGKAVRVGERIPIWQALGVPQDPQVALPIKHRITRKEPVKFFNERVTVAELTTRSFAYLRHVAEQELKEPVVGCVVSIPSLVGNEYRQPLSEIIRVAGFHSTHLMSEPILATFEQFNASDSDRPALVVCLGAGGLEAMIIRRDQGKLVELEKGGRERVSGQNFTDRLARHLYDRFFTQLPQHLRDDKQILWQISIETERVKVALSTAEETPVRLPGLEPIPIRRAEFEQVIQGLVAESVALCAELTARAKIAPLDLANVLLAGGSTAIPLLQAEISRWYGRVPTIANEYSVAYGAALLTAKLDLSAPPPEPQKRALSPAPTQPAARPAAPALHPPAPVHNAPALSALETSMLNYVRATSTQLGKQDYDGALETLAFLSKLVQHQRAVAYFLRAKYREGAGKMQDALQDYERAVKLHDAKAEYRQACAELLWRMAEGKIRQMDNLFKQGRKGDANRYRKEALRWIQSALKYAPHDPHLRHYEEILRRSH